MKDTRGKPCGHQRLPDLPSIVVTAPALDPTSVALSRCRRGRKCAEIPLKADRNRCACRGDLKRFIARSRCRVGVRGQVKVTICGQL